MTLNYFQEGLTCYLNDDYKASIISFEKVIREYKRSYALIYHNEKILNFIIDQLIVNLSVSWVIFLQIITSKDLPRNKRAKLLSCLGTLQINVPTLSILDELINSKKTNEARKIGFKAIRTTSAILERKINRTISNLKTLGLGNQGGKLWS